MIFLFNKINYFLSVLFFDNEIRNNDPKKVICQLKKGEKMKKNKKILVFNTITCLLMWVFLFSGFSDSIDTSRPAGTDDPSEADDNMRRIQAGFQQRLDVDHVFALSGTTVDAADTGEHTKITYNVTIADPTQVASKSHLYMQNDELRYQDDSNTAFDLTSAGKLGSASTDLTVNNAIMAGTLEATGLTTVADGSVTKTTAAPTTDAMIANMKYVDDQITANAKSLGAWDSSSFTVDTAYQATTDGFVIATARDANIAGLEGFTDGNADPTGTRVQMSYIAHGGGTPAASVTFPVRSGDFWRVNGIGTNGTFEEVNWIPLD